MSSKDTDKERPMNSKIDEAVKELFGSFLSRYQIDSDLKYYNIINVIQCIINVI